MASIVIDLDGVMADFLTSFTTLGQEMGLVDRIWSHDEHLAPSIQLVWTEVGKRPWWWLGLQPLVNDEELAMIRALQEEHQIVFCTSRKAGTPHPQVQSREWLAKIGLPEASVICSNRKEEIASGVNASYVLDDSLGVVNRIGPPCRTYVLDRPYNRKGREDWVREVKRVEKFLRDVKNWV